jgi:serine/threonine protein kinase
MMTRKQGPFPADQVLTWGDQLLDALDYLHTQDPQIIHRDIKPQNLKLTGRGQIILLDFGLAKGQTGGVSVVTTSASIFGYTPNYAPLEQIQGLGTDARSDIYALSATLYHLMTAVKPPDALTRAAALVNGQSDPLTPANEISNSIGPEVAGVLARAMSQNRDQRYPTAAAMRDALKGTGEAATLIGRSEAATMIVPPSAATLADGSLATKADSTPTMLKTGETTVVRTGTTTPPRRVAPWLIGVAALVLIGVLFGGFFAYQRRGNPDAGVPTAHSPEPTPDNASAQGSPATEHGAAAPVSGQLNDVKKSVIGDHPPANEPAKTEVARKAEKTKTKPQDKSVKAEVEPNPDDEGEAFNPVVPNPPETGTQGVPRPNRQAFPQMGIPQTRTLRDGTKVMTLADGTRIVTMPNGTRRVIRPGARLLRRKGVQ